MKVDNGFNIYDKVYEKLLELNKDEIPVSTFYHLVENMKIPKEEVINIIEHKLLDIGLSTIQVDRICSNLSLKLRWTKRDVKHIENHLREEGCISRRGFKYIEIKKL